jgi:hypothetical protein
MLVGTWQLISSHTTEKGRTTVTDYTKGQRMIKLITPTHFSFLRHDLQQGKDGRNNFDAGGGRYTLLNNTYTEYLDYYNNKNWEGKIFTFKIRINRDTLLQTGIEKVDAEGVNRSITEKYVRIKS